LDIKKRHLNIIGIHGQLLSPEEIGKVLDERKKQWQPPDRKVRKGVFKRYTQGAVSAMKGAYME